MNVLIIGPALSSKGRGNRMTAVRWGRILEGLGHQVAFANEYGGQDCDLLVALHCIASHDSVAAFRAAHPERPCIAAITGTDVYGLGSMFDENGLATARSTMGLATRIVAFHPLALDEIPDALRDKGLVIHQSAEAPRADGAADRERLESAPPAAREDLFEVCVVGELREVKDPFRAALAARRLPTPSRIRILHAGAASDEEVAVRAAKEEQANARYTWLGEISHQDTLQLMARCRLLVISSRHEGGANALTEALAVGLPIVATRIPGNVGLLGDGYPGYFDVEDTEALCELLARAEAEPAFYHSLEQACGGLADLASPERERRAWQALLAEIGA